MEDIVYFRDLVNFETRKLEFLCEAWNNKFTEGKTPETETGHILSVIGILKYYEYVFLTVFLLSFNQ